MTARDVLVGHNKWKTVNATSDPDTRTVSKHCESKKTTAGRPRRRIGKKHGDM